MCILATFGTASTVVHPASSITAVGIAAVHTFVDGHGRQLVRHAPRMLFGGQFVRQGCHLLVLWNGNPLLARFHPLHGHLRILMSHPEFDRVHLGRLLVQRLGGGVVAQRLVKEAI